MKQVVAVVSIDIWFIISNMTRSRHSVVIQLWTNWSHNKQTDSSRLTMVTAVRGCRRYWNVSHMIRRGTATAVNLKSLYWLISRWRIFPPSCCTRSSIGIKTAIPRKRGISPISWQPAETHTLYNNTQNLKPLCLNHGVLSGSTTLTWYVEQFSR